MTRRTKFTVHFGKSVARFSDYADAMRFARMASVVGSVWMTAGEGQSEVVASDGIIGQFVDGKATPEFAHLDR